MLREVKREKRTEEVERERGGEGERETPPPFIYSCFKYIIYYGKYKERMGKRS